MDGFSMGFLGFFYGFSIGFLVVFYGFSSGFQMVGLWFFLSKGLSTALLDHTRKSELELSRGHGALHIFNLK